MVTKHSLTDLCRKVVFRGMAHGGEWVYGSLIQVGACCLIWGDGAQEGVEVYPGSVGQDTMIRDTHGKAIFEGDIVGMRLSWTRVSLPMDMGLFRVEYHSGAFMAVSPSEAMPLCDLPEHVVIEVQMATFEGAEDDEDT